MDIILLKKRLNELGFGPLSVEGPEAKVFGPKTTEAVKNFQIGNFLEPDGQVGPKTLAALFPASITAPDKYHIQPWQSTQTTLRLRALDILTAQNGVRERTSNAGPAIEVILASVGLGPGYSWCAAFVYWGFDQAARELGIKNPLPRTGGCLNHWNTTHGLKFKTEQEPVAGDVFIMKVGTAGAGHTGVVISYNKSEGTVHTIEGNTNNDSSPNGDGVYFRDRKVERLLGFIEY